jgi:hypothetical protein
MNLRLPIYNRIDTPQAKGKGSGREYGHAWLPGAVPVRRGWRDKTNSPAKINWLNIKGEPIAIAIYSFRLEVLKSP